VSPIFRHGRLRLYLLKLLDEAPRHGYEVIRLLQDRFMGVYSPSPGTIYPRLARLEEDGLVTHDEVDGRKVYRITDKGREEIQARLDDLAELEEELTESVRDIAREVTVDVRDTVRSLREEITWAARDFRRENKGEPQDGPAEAQEASEATEPGRDEHDEHDEERQRAWSDDAARIREDARRAREEMRSRRHGPGQAGPGSGPGAGRRSRPGAGAGAGSGSKDPWGAWADRASAWQSFGERGERGERGQQGERRGPGGRPGWANWQDLAGGMPPGLDRLASDFAKELRTAAGHAGDIGEGALGDLRNILADTLARIRDEVFAGSEPAEAQQAETAHTEPPAAEGTEGQPEPGPDHGDDDPATP
jgi:DNA-binding PadR family transcriptional regulator